jgi:hypothetical protein
MNWLPLAEFAVCHGSSLDLSLGHVTVDIHSEGAILVHSEGSILVHLEEAILAHSEGTTGIFGSSHPSSDFRLSIKPEIPFS